MTIAQELTLKSSEIRQRLNVLQTAEKRSAEELAEMDRLTKELTDVETRFRAALATETTVDDDFDSDVQLRMLANRANAGEVFEAALEHRSTSGATREIQDEFSLNYNQIPLALLRGTEERVLTPAPANVGQNQNEIIPGVFPMSCAAFLGVDRPTVAVGEAIFPVLATNATAHTPAEGAAAGETTGSFSADVLTPARIQSAFEYSIEDRARFSGLDSSLRTNLNAALENGLDKEVLAGTNGFLGSSGLTNPTDPGSEADFAAYRALVYDAAVVDGLYAHMASDVRLVVGPATYAHAAGKYRSNNSDDSAIDSLMNLSGGVKVSSHIPTVANHVQGLILSKSPMMRNAVSPVWEGVTIIPDEVTKAESGTIIITAVMLHAVKILRAAAFARKEVHTG